MVSKENNKNSMSGISRPIQIGFSSESREIEQGLDLNKLLIKKPSSTFFFRLSENLYKSLGLMVNDILIVDRSITPFENSIVILSSDNGFMIAKFKTNYYELLKCYTKSGNNYENENGSSFWGVVTGVVRVVKGGLLWSDTMD